MKIKAAVSWDSDKPFTIEELELDAPRENEVIVKVLGVGLCHTDLLIKGLLGPTPAVLGHEGAGIVEEVGSKVKKVQPGDHVALSFASCGECPNCKKGEYAYCSDFVRYNSCGRRPSDGSPTLKKDDLELYGSFFVQSSFANYCLCEEQNVVKVDKDLPIEILGPLGCGIGTGAGTVMNRLNPKAGSSIVIFGTGTVGMSAIMMAKVVGCTKIIAVDVLDSRLETAKELGATHTINAKKEDPVQAITEICDGLGADYSCETSGNPSVAKQAVSCLQVKGSCAIVGMASGDMILDYDSVRLGRTVFGVMEGDSMPDTFIPKLLELYKQGIFPFDKLIKKYPLSEINQAVEDSHDGKVIKAVLIP